jgi:DNA-binding beta-propeller fold protein YncE
VRSPGFLRNGWHSRDIPKTGERRNEMKTITVLLGLCFAFRCAAAELVLPYDGPRTQREEVFAFTEKPQAKLVGKDKYEIAFAVKGNCDVTVGIVDAKGRVIRHLASGVLGRNAPSPFQKNTLSQKIYWNGKNDFGTYVKEPGKLKLRVMLGLKPEFDKRLGGTSPKNIPGKVRGLAIDRDGAYVFSMSGDSRIYIRRFDHDGNYVKSLVPPPADLPEEKLGGMGYVEYEPGKKAVHSSDGGSTVSSFGSYVRCIMMRPYDWRPAAAGGRIYYCNAGDHQGGSTSALHYVYTDGSTDVPGTAGKHFAWGVHSYPRLAVSPDAKWIYMVQEGDGGVAHQVLRCSTGGTDKATVFVGTGGGKYGAGRPGGDNAHLNSPSDVTCDAKGRIYVADSRNNRIQVFSPDGAYLKTVAIERPRCVQVHAVTGAIYVMHLTRVRGASVNRITKLTSLDNPKKETSFEVKADLMTLDSWTEKPRLWVIEPFRIGAGSRPSNGNVTVWEEQGASFERIVDFQKEAQEEAGRNYIGRWKGEIRGYVVCDPVRQHAYYSRHVFDLRTGNLLWEYRVSLRKKCGSAFDGKGYLHVHAIPMRDEVNGVVRYDPSQRTFDPESGQFPCHPSLRHIKWATYEEVPYDYGIPVKPKKGKPVLGALPTRCQRGAKFFQDGMGVNPSGDIAVESNIYYVPKMETIGETMACEGVRAGMLRGRLRDGTDINYRSFMRDVQEMQKRGQSVYYIPRRPGVPLAAGTVWVFDRSGELRRECAVNGGRLINGVQIDEDGCLYFTDGYRRMLKGSPFLAGKGGVFGVPDPKKLPAHLIRRFGGRSPFTGTFIKTGGKKMWLLVPKAPVRMDRPPSRPQELDGAWVEGDVKWLYAGASPIVPGGCSCPSMRANIDWYKRSFVPEAYRQSIGVLDSNGNLVMHLGRYGSLDSGDGAKSRIPLGGDNISIAMVYAVGVTDDYIAFNDHGERIAVLKIGYHAEEVVDIQ